MIGQITLTLKNANFKRNTELILQMDPFIVFKCGKIDEHTAICKAGGTKPFWNQTFTFRIVNQPVIEFQAWDYETLGDNDLICTGILELAKLLKEPFNGAITMNYKKQYAGLLFVYASFKQDEPQHKPVQPSQPVQLPKADEPVVEPEPYKASEPAKVPEPVKEPEFIQEPINEPEPIKEPVREPKPVQEPEPDFQFEEPVQKQEVKIQFADDSDFFPPPPDTIPKPWLYKPDRLNPMDFQPQFLEHSSEHHAPVHVFFNPDCEVCKGEGSYDKDGKLKNCTECFKAAGLCQRCFGTGFNEEKQRPCKCQAEQE